MSNDIQQQLNSLNQQAIRLNQEGRYDEAIQTATQAVALAGQHLEKNHPHYATVLDNLASLYETTGNYAAALPLQLQALEIRQVLGEDLPNYSVSLTNLAVLYQSMGNYAAAEPLYQKALALRGKTLGKHHQHYASSLNNLSGLYQLMGHYAAAATLQTEAVEIHRTTLGEHHEVYATALASLAVLHRLMGNYTAAEPLYQKALEVYRAVLGENHPQYARTLASYALLYDSMGNYASAEPLFQQAVQIQRTALGDQHPDYAASLNNLAALYQSRGNYATAETLCRQAMDICSRTLGEDHPDYGASLTNLALLYQLRGDSDKAVALQQQALEIDRKTAGPQHPKYARALNNLAAHYLLMGKCSVAEPLYRQSWEILRKALGEYHPEIATLLIGLARLYVVMGRKADSLTLLQKAAAIDDRTIGQVFSIGSESQRMAYLTTLRSSFEIFLSLVTQYFFESPPARKWAFDLVLRRKAIGAEALAAQRDAVLGGKYPELAPKLEALTALRMQVAQKTLAGPGDEGIAPHQSLLAEWNQRKDQLEVELVRLIPEMNLEKKLQAANRQAVALALPTDSVLIEFVRLSIFDFMAVLTPGEPHWYEPHYLAFVFAAQEPDKVQMVDLGSANSIDAMIATFRATITGEGENRGYHEQEGSPRQDFIDRTTADGAALRAVIFDSLLTAIGDRKRLLLAPDGDLTRLPFEVLPTANGRRLIDDYRISYLGAGRDVLRLGETSKTAATAPLVVADPDFDLASVTATSLPQAASGNASSPKPAAGFWSNLFGQGSANSTPLEGQRVQTSQPRLTLPPGRLSRDAESAMHFGRLPGTKVEGQRIGRMLGVEPRLAATALESQLKACRSPIILHLATHGFFHADQKHDPNESQLIEMSLGGQSPERMGRFSGRGLENPLLRSGLALAGVNSWMQQGTVPIEAEDGILTAEDVSGLDLLATELVVLSACETGLGEVRTGEGVFGLRRAFVLAGARTLVMSLWKVSDLSTAILMERFYLNLLQRKLGRDESLREAQFYTRDLSVGEIREDWLRAEVIESLSAGNERAKSYFQRLARKPDEHRPFSDVEYWGAFICQGDPAAMFLIH